MGSKFAFVVLWQSEVRSCLIKSVAGREKDCGWEERLRLREIETEKDRASENEWMSEGLFARHSNHVYWWEINSHFPVLFHFPPFLVFPPNSSYWLRLWLPVNLSLSLLDSSQRLCRYYQSSKPIHWLNRHHFLFFLCCQYLNIGEWWRNVFFWEIRRKENI